MVQETWVARNNLGNPKDKHEQRVGSGLAWPRSGVLLSISCVNPHLLLPMEIGTQQRGSQKKTLELSRYQRVLSFFPEG